MVEQKRNTEYIKLLNQQADSSVQPQKRQIYKKKSKCRSKSACSIKLVYKMTLAKFLQSLKSNGVSDEVIKTVQEMYRGKPSLMYS